MSQVGVIHPDTFVSGVDGSAVSCARTEIQSFLVDSDTDIAVGDWVMLDVDATGTALSTNRVLKASTKALGQTLVVGVALDAVTANTDGQVIRVVTAGYAALANVADAVVAGGALAVIATAGRGEAFLATGIARPIGVALTDGSAGNTASVWVYKAL